MKALHTAIRPKSEESQTPQYINRSGPMSWKSKLASFVIIGGFIYYVMSSGLGWAAGDSPFLSGFYTIVCVVTLLIMISGVFWRSFTHLPPAKGRVLAIIPVFNEDPKLLQASVWSLINQTVLPDQIHVIDDGSARPLATFDHPLVTWHHQANAGKRHAQASILRRFSPNQWDYLFTVDSDSVLDPDALEHMLRSMSDPTVQAATGMIFVRNWKDNFLTRITDINVVVACQMLRMFRSWFGLVTPTSGALALYRASLVYDNLEDYITSGTAGDDRRLSFYALMRGKVVAVHEAVVETALPDKWGKVFNQRLRWSKSAWLGIPFVLTNMNFATVILYMYPLVFALMWPWIAGFLIYTNVRYGDKALWAGVLFWVIVSVAMTAIYCLYRPSFTWKERLAQFALSPIYPIFGLIILRPACYAALTKLKSNSWHTRGADDDDFDETTEMSKSSESIPLRVN